MHANIAHLLSNIIFGFIALSILSSIIGNGLSWFLVILSGFIGNIINSFVQHHSHSAIGASTAVFGAFGLIASFQVINGYKEKNKLKKWLPIGGALGLLGFLGSSGYKTDLGGHFFGFTSGIILGFFAAIILYKRKKPRRNIQNIFIAINFFIIIYSWLKSFSL